MPDSDRDMSIDTLEDGEWLSYRELAERRGISDASVRKLIRRHRWRQQKDDQGVVRILLPEGWQEASVDTSPDDTGDSNRDMAAALAELAATFDGIVSALRAAHEAHVAELQKRLTVAETACRASEAACAAAETRTEAAEIEALRLEQENRERLSRPRWHRALEAWRGH